MRRADAPSMEPGRGEWRPNDMRLWTKDELIAEIGRLEAWTDDRERLVAERDTAVALLQEAVREGVLPPSFKERAWRFLANPMRRASDVG